MLHSGALLLLSALAAHTPAATTTNLVQVCSVVAGTCGALPAATLDPTLRPAAEAGQLAFVDPETRTLVPATAEQAAELAARLAIVEEQKAAVEPIVKTLADGTVLVRGDFGVYLRAELRPAAATAMDKTESQEETP